MDGMKEIRTPGDSLMSHAHNSLTQVAETFVTDIEDD